MHLVTPGHAHGFADTSYHIIIGCPTHHVDPKFMKPAYDEIINVVHVVKSAGWERSPPLGGARWGPRLFVVLSAESYIQPMYFCDIT